MTPKITVLMAVYNGEAYLKQCMDSVLDQTYGDFEFLIVDDGSTDRTKEIITSYKDNRIRLIENGSNLSQVRSLNIGLDYAIGEYIARIDADDIMFPERFEKQLAFLVERPEMTLVGSWGEVINENGKRKDISRLPVRTEEIIAAVLFGEFISIHSSVMYRKRPIMAIGKYNEDFSFTEDYKLLTDLLLNGYKVANIPQLLVKSRFHDDRISVRDSKPQIERYVVALRQFNQKFTGAFTGSERDLLFDFLYNAGSMNERYWQQDLTKEDMRKIMELGKSLLSNVGAYFKLQRRQMYLIKRIFYSRIISFAYKGCFVRRSLSIEAYLSAVKNFIYIFSRPRLYVYPLGLAYSCMLKK